MEKITIELPIVKVRTEDPWFGCDYGKEHYDDELFVIDDGICRYFAMWDGLSLWHCPMPHDSIDKYLVEKAIINNDEIYHRDMEAIGERLAVIEKLCNDSNSELYRQKDKLDRLPKSGESVNILDVARAAAVIQKPELIKELSK